MSINSVTDMSVNPWEGLYEGTVVADPRQQKPLQIFNAGPSCRNGGALETAHEHAKNVGFIEVREVEDSGENTGFRLVSLPARLESFTRTEHDSFKVPIIVEVLDPDALSAFVLDERQEMVTEYYFTIGSHNSVSHDRATTFISPSNDSFQGIMHQICALAAGLTRYQTIATHRNDWGYVLIASCPLFQQTITADNWSWVWPVLRLNTVKLHLYLIETCPSGKLNWDTWQR